MGKIKKVRCINPQGNVRWIAETLTHSFTFKDDGWEVQEIEGVECPQGVPKEKAKSAAAHKEKRIALARRLLEDEGIGVDEPELVKEVQPEEKTTNPPKQTTEQFHDELTSIKGIGKATADDIIRVFETKEKLLVAIEKSTKSKKQKDKLPFTAGANKALLNYK